MGNIHILWVDDEIDSLKAHTIFLTGKDYKVSTLTNGHDALDFIKTNEVDVVLLDESMPGITGLETLAKIKEMNQHIPVVLITKNEAENIMDEAIGNQIADYLIKPVNPHQILLCLKKILNAKQLVAEATTANYQRQFTHLFMELNSNPNYNQWMELYRKLVYWELEMEKSDSPEMREVLANQKQEANAEFSKFIQKNYTKWFTDTVHKPVMSHHVFAQKILPKIQPDKSTFLIVVDNLRFDQWKVIQPALQQYFKTVEEDTYYSILPTATQYCRNALFAGLTPADIQRLHPNFWKNDDEEGGKNLYEDQLFEAHLKRIRKADVKFSYHKIIHLADGQQMVQNIQNWMKNDLNIIVYNFVDMLSHARTEMEVLKELAPDEVSYRSITKSWFEHSPLFQALKKISEKPVNLIITTDHGSVKVKAAHKVIGDRTTTTNLRYKHGKNLNYEERDVMAVRVPTQAGLPTPTINSSFIFAKEDGFLCYPNNYNQYVNMYKNTFQHGGISLEEMIVPIVTLTNK